MGHVLKGYMMLAAYRADLLPAARAASGRRAAHMQHATAREQAHVAALDHWIAGDQPRGRGLEPDPARPPARHPRFPSRPFRQFLARPAGGDARLGAGGRAAWSRRHARLCRGILGCRCFAHEECGYYTEAEHAGRDAIRRDPGDLWAAHGVAHVLEMTGRRREGIDWIAGLQARWDGGNNIKHHLWWHQAMYHLELGELDKVLALYDAGFRDLASPLTRGVPDLYIDVQNAASMLFRLGAARRRCRRPLGRAGRQGRGADRRLPVRLHPAALDDGAGRHRPRRGGGTHAGGDAGFRQGPTGRCQHWCARSGCR